MNEPWYPDRREEFEETLIDVASRFRQEHWLPRPTDRSAGVDATFDYLLNDMWLLDGPEHTWFLEEGEYTLATELGRAIEALWGRVDSLDDAPYRADPGWGTVQRLAAALVSVMWANDAARDIWASDWSKVT